MASAFNKLKLKGSGSASAKYFNPKRRGELGELRQELNANNQETIKEAVKRVIAHMTVGKDVSSLFADVIRSMGTQDVELKKLIYLYIMNYARSQPELAILVINSFVKDASNHHSPLIRALAIRTMGCIRVDKITEHLCDPLAAALKDPDPYVRKTAAVCVAKLYEGNAELVEEKGMVAALRELLGDSNPMVVANAVSSLAEIAQISGQDLFRFNDQLMQRMLVALNECTEWGQVALMDVLARYEPTEDQALVAIQRVLPRTKHANPAVVLSAVNLIIGYSDRALQAIDRRRMSPGADSKVLAEREALIRSVQEDKIPPSLLTLLASDKSEIVYVALRNISLLLQQRRGLFDRAPSSVTHFFCKYNDPLYVKLEKLDILVRLASPQHIDRILMELRQYCTEVDIPFVRKAVACIGLCALKVEAAAEKCVKLLHDVVAQAGAHAIHTIQAAVLAFRDIFRRYPNRYESVIDRLYQSSLGKLETDVEAKAAMVWIIGEYSDRIREAPAILEAACESFLQDAPAVQLQLLTACVKLHLRRPEEGQALVTQVLKRATKECRTVDIRDRAYLYWRLLSTDTEIAAQVILAQRPAIDSELPCLGDQALAELVQRLTTLASVYHAPPEYFLKNPQAAVVLKAGGDPRAAGGRRKGRGGDASSQDGSGSDEDTDSSSDSSSDSDSDSDSGDSDSSSSGSSSDSDDGEAKDDSLEQQVRQQRRHRKQQRKQQRKKPAAAPAVVPELDIFAGVTGEFAGLPGFTPQEPAAGSNSTATGLPEDPMGLSAFDMLDSLGPQVSPQPNGAAASAGGALDLDPLGIFGGGAPEPQAATPQPSPGPPASAQLVLAPGDANGLQLHAELVPAGPGAGPATVAGLRLFFHNQGQAAIRRFAIRFDASLLGLEPEESLRAVPALAPGQQHTHTLPLRTGANRKEQAGPLHAALKTDFGVYYFQVPIPFGLFLRDRPAVGKGEFLQLWPTLGDAGTAVQPGAANNSPNLSDLKARFAAAGVHYVAKSKNPERGMLVYFSLAVLGESVLLEINITGPTQCNLVAKAADRCAALAAVEACSAILRA